MTIRRDFYKCPICGNIVGMVKDGGGTLVCCGKPMEILVPNSKEAATEKHIPVFTKEGGKVTVTVGSVEHPMLPEHYIEWICIQDDTGHVQRKVLEPGKSPVAVFEGVSDSFTIFEHCNLHGLWKNA